jgi:hypothetical protein
LDADLSKGLVGNISYHSVTWEKELGKESWFFHHVLRISTKYPWLMLYFRSDATFGFSGGYHYPTRGMSKIVSNAPIKEKKKKKKKKKKAMKLANECVGGR